MGMSPRIRSSLALHGAHTTVPYLAEFQHALRFSSKVPVSAWEGRWSAGTAAQMRRDTLLLYDLI
jgi:hypothetical protein